MKTFARIFTVLLGFASLCLFAASSACGAVVASNLDPTGTEVASDSLQTTLAAISNFSWLFPLIGLITAISLTQFLRRRRMAQLRSGSR